MSVIYANTKDDINLNVGEIISVAPNDGASLIVSVVCKGIERQRFPVSAAQTIGPFDETCQISMSAMSGNIIYSVDRYQFTKPTPTTTAANLGSASAAGKEVVLVDSFGKLMKSVGTEYREVSFLKSDQVPPDIKQITATGQVVFTKGTVTSITLLSGSITELTLRDGLVQTYTDANTTDNVAYTIGSLVVGEPMKYPIPFFFGLHATVVGTTPVISLEISSCS